VTRTFVLLVALFLLFSPLPTQAATYNVNISGNSSLSPFPLLSLVGTVDYDGPDLGSIALSIINPRDTTNPVQPISLYQENQFGLAWNWVGTPTALYFEPTGFLGVAFITDPATGSRVSLGAGAGDAIFGIKDQVTGDIYSFEMLGGPTSAAKIEFGTKMAPEPSSFVMAITGCVLAGGFSVLRRRFKKSQA
jgi:hypothetical protein